MPPKFHSHFSGFVFGTRPLRLLSSCFKEDLSLTQDLRRQIEITPVKDSHTRIKPFDLASGHDRYITITPEQALVSCVRWRTFVIIYITVIDL